MAPVPAAAAPAAASEIPLRRGLPRVAGGEPWPPAGFARLARPERVMAVAPTPEPQPTPPSAVAPADAPAAEVTAEADISTPAAAPVRVSTPRARLSPIAAATLAAAASRPSPPEPEPRPWFRPTWPRAVSGLLAALGLLILAAGAVALVRVLLSTPAGMDFLARFPGEYHSPVDPAPGFPAWVRWQHFFNVFLVVLIIRSGLQVRQQEKPPAYWSPRWNPQRKISITLWLHQSLDILWLANGVVFVVLLFVTGHWARIVPTSWEVFPNAVSAALQYVSLDWPTEHGWANYNSLQQLAYFATVFLAAPLAAITGVRMSGVWPKNAKTLNRIYPVEVARAIHFPLMLYFVVFIIGHVALVFATGTLRNLNHMYAGQDVVNWAGFWIFAVSIALIVAAWMAARPLVIAPIARLFGTVSSR